MTRGAPRGGPGPHGNGFADIDAVVAAIGRGGVAGVPTDTVYGLACDPRNMDAVDRIYAIKLRPAGLELTLLAGSLAEAEEAVELNAEARMLAARYWPGPLSIIAPLRRCDLAIPRIGGTLSCRIPDHDLLRRLLRRTGPLASTSANRHGEPPATTAEAVHQSLGPELDAVLDGGPAGGLASSIIDCGRTPPQVVREGPISAAELLAHVTAARPAPEHDGG